MIPYLLISGAIFFALTFMFAYNAGKSNNLRKDKLFYSSMALCAFGTAVFSSAIAGVEGTRQDWREYIECVPGETEIGPLTIHDCEEYYNVPDTD